MMLELSSCRLLLGPQSHFSQQIAHALLCCCSKSFALLQACILVIFLTLKDEQILAATQQQLEVPETAALIEMAGIGHAEHSADLRPG